jgi:hypothetical protein
VEQADLEEGEARLAGAELVFELDEERREEATVHEELRVVHQDGIRPETERGQHRERIARDGIVGGLARGSHAGALLSL